MSISEGQLSMTVTLDAGQVSRVGVQSTRPPPVQKVLVGKTVAEAQTLVPALFSVCRQGQAVAFNAALAAAQGKPPPDSALSVELEALEHHAWHLDMEWPRAIGQTPRVVGLKQTLELIRDVRAGEPLTQLVTFLRRRLAQILAGTTEEGSLEAQFLQRCAELDQGARWAVPRLRQPTLAEVVDGLNHSTSFAARPQLSGPLEVGALTRVSTSDLLLAQIKRTGWGLQTRAIARVLDAAHAVERLATQNLHAVSSLSLGPGEGAAMVEVARGPLVHRVRVEGDRVVAWASVAPTEWTFHPDGAPQLMRGTMAPSVQQRAQMLVTLLDPCVACSVEVLNA